MPYFSMCGNKTVEDDYRYYRLLKYRHGFVLVVVSPDDIVLLVHHGYTGRVGYTLRLAFAYVGCNPAHR